MKICELIHENMWDNVWKYVRQYMKKCEIIYENKMKNII